jgi:CRP-like cAMP-binding protein
MTIPQNGFAGDLTIGGALPGPVRTIRLEVGAHLFHQGDPAKAIYHVARGCLRLERCTPAGALVVLHTARSGELLAEGALVADTYHCNAVATQDSDVHVYEKAAILANLEPGSPAHTLVVIMARHLLNALQRIELRDVRSARERVMLYFEQMADHNGDVAIDTQLQEIAGLLGLSRETLYRALADLERERRIERSLRRISIRRP